MRMYRWGSLFVVAAVGLAGCGGGGEQLTKAEYARQGNELCERIEQRVTQAASSQFSQQGEIPSAEKITSFARETLAPALEEELDALGELSPPEQDEERVNDILQAGRRSIEEVQRDPTSLIGERNPLDDYDELADGYGLERCGGISDEVDRALTGRGATGPVRGGDGTNPEASGEEQSGQAGGGDDAEEAEQDVTGAGGEPAEPTETTADTTG
jgi:hypothetical protein